MYCENSHQSEFMHSPEYGLDAEKPTVNGWQSFLFYGYHNKNWYVPWKVNTGRCTVEIGPWDNLITHTYIFAMLFYFCQGGTAQGDHHVLKWWLLQFLNVFDNLFGVKEDLARILIF